MSFLAGLKCSICATPFEPEALYVCNQCLGPLEVIYDRDGQKATVTREVIEKRAPSLWRYRELLPIQGEPLTGFASGFTPLVGAQILQKDLGVEELLIKADSVSRRT